MSTNATKLLSLEEIEAIRARAEAATSGPWIFSKQYSFRYILSSDNEILWSGEPNLDEDNMQFCAAARTDVPALCDTALQAIKDRDELIEALNTFPCSADCRGLDGLHSPFCAWLHGSKLLARIREQEADK